MKNLFQLFSSCIIVLSAFMLPACEQENLSPGSAQATVKNPERVSSTPINPGCLQRGYPAADNDPFKPKSKITFPCFYLTIDPDWPFVERCLTCASGVPDLRRAPRPDPWDYHVFSVNRSVLCVQYYNLTPNRDANYFILRENVELSQETADELSVSRKIIPAGRYVTTYDAARELYVAFITLR